MSTDNQEKSTEFPSKYKKVLNQDFIDNADSLSEEDLKKMIVTCEGNLYTIEKEKEADVKLNAAKDLVKEYSAVYSENTKYQRAKIAYCMFLLENKGVDVGDTEKE